MTVVENCQLEWDEARGVLYVHNKANGTSVLRVQGLPTDSVINLNEPGQMLDVNLRKVSRPADDRREWTETDVEF